MTFFGRAVHSSLSKRARLPQRRTLFLEPLEDRRLLATFNVNSFLDTVDANPGDGVASDGANTTLRAAIMEANALPGPDTINLPAGTYNLTIAGRSEDAAAQGDLDVTGDLQILGAGAGATIIDGKQLDRVFDIRTSSTNNVTIELRDLTITGGDARALSGGGSLEDHGGGIRTDFYAFVTIANSVLSNNAAIRSPDPSVSYGVGAAIASSARVLTIEDSQIIGNTSSNSGGGLYFSGTVGGQPGTAIIRGSTFADNRAVSGGAIFNHGIIQIENSTLSNNTARHSSGTVGGGGAINNNNGGDVTLTNTTLSGNDALSGGAIINFDRVTALNSTIAGNSASTRGGGIYQSSSSSATQSLSVRNTIIANNTASSAGPDISERSAGTITSLGNNLIGNTSDSGGFGIASDLLNVNPLLGPLAANGGVTQTHELLSGSPAIDSANVVAAPSTDQRLVARPQGAADDIGAFETTNNLAYLDLSINPSSVVEDQGAGAATGTLTRGGDLSRPLTVFLTSSDETEATAPVSVTIAANATSATFPITAIDDAIVDGTKTVTFTARDSSGPPAFDPTFGTGGLAPAGIEQNDSFNDLDLIVQPDGKLLTLGDDSDPTNAWRVARRNADGSADTTFGSGGAVATSFANSTGARPFGMALQADGAIVVVGIVEGGTSTWTDWGMARYLPNGTLDPSFGAGGLVRMEFPNEGRWLTDVTVAPNGKILVSGSSNRVGMQFQVARFNSNGTLDASFGTNGIVTDDSLPISSSEYAAKVMLQPDGKILLAGKAGKGDGQNSEFAIYRYHSNGTKDTSFSGDGFQKIYVGDYNVVDLQDLDMQADGKILLNGYVGNGSFKYATVIRLNSNGSLDTSFDGDGYKRFTVGGSSFTQSMAMALDDEGKIVLAGKAYSNQTTGNDLMLVRLNSNGSFDTSFDGDGHALFSLQAWPKQEYIYAAAFQSSGKLAALLVSDGVEQVARFSINSPRHILASDTLDVSDDGEPGPPLVVTIDRNQVFEYAGTGAANVTIQRSGTSGPLTVTLTSSDTTELVVQPTVTIPDGQSSVVVPLDAVDDTLLDDPQTVIITASASGYSEGSDSIIVAGFEDLAFSIDKASIAIGGETATATLTRLNTDVDDPLIVNVQYENATDLVVPDLVEIPAGQQSVTFQIASSDNGIVEGNRTIQFVVHQTGYFNAADTLEVREGGIVSVDSVADGHATDVSPLGSFDSVATPTFELETRVTPTLERRSLFEFDISSLTGSLDAASLTLRTSGLTTSGGVGPTIEVFGYVGDGALSPTDAELGQKVGELQIPGDGTGMRRYGIPLDLSFMQSAIGTNQYIGFSTRIASGSSVSFVSSRNTFSHESNHPKLQFAFATQTSPVANDDLASTDEDTAIAIDVLTNDSGSGLTVSSTTVPSNGTAIINPDNTITYTPNANFNGTDSFVYTMSDGSESDSASVTITVNPINDPPVAANDEYFTSEDTTLVVTSTLGPPALDQQSLAFDHFISTTAFQLQQQVKVGTTGRLNSVDVYIDQGSSAALGEFPGTEIGASLTVYINRGATWQTDAHDFSTQITINSSMINNWVTIDTSSAGIDLAAGEVFMLGTQGASGGVFLAESREENAGNSYPDGQLWRDGAPHVSGSSGFDLRFRTSMRPEVSTEGVLNNDSDHDGDSLTAVVVSTTANGNLSFNANGTFSYVPNTGFFGVDSFTYKAHDGTVLSNEATVSITVTHVNHQPDAVDDIAMTDEDTSVIIDVRNNDTDSDGDSLLLLRVTQPANGQAFIDNNQNVLYIPAANFNGADSFTYTLSDGNGGVDTATVNVTVNSVNDTPQASNDSASTDEDTSVTIDVLANDSDVDGDNLTVTSLSDPANGTAIVNIDGTVTYSPAANFYGTDTFTYRANDGTANSNLVTVTITVRPVNDAPVARDDAFTLYEDSYILVGSGIIFGNDTDVDNTSLTAVVNQRPTRGSLALNSNGSFRYDPGPDFNGIDTFTYRAHDGNLSSNAATVTLTVLPSNDAPDPTADTYFLDEDVPLTIAAPGVLANDEDIDGDSFTARLVTVLMNGSLQLNPDGSFTYTPNPDFHGVEIFSYVADDGIDESFPVEVLLVVRSVEDAPRAANDTYVTQEDTTLQVAAAGVLANDIEPDGDPLTASLHTPPSHGSVSLASDGSFVYSPVNNYTGPDSFTYFANDGKSNVDVATVSITVTAVNDAPVARNDSYSTDEDSALTIAAPGVLGNDTDVDGDTLSAAVVNNPGNGSLTLNDDGSFTYTPNANFNGADSFSYSIDDGNGGSDTATVQIEVRAVNDDPDVMDAVFSLEENSPNGTPVGAVAATDLEGDLLQFAISGTDAAAFAIDSQTGRISVVDAALLDFETQSQFDFLVEVTDGKGGHSTASVLVNLTDVLEIAIDVLPNDPDNQINLKSKEIEVAILGSAGFDLLAKVDLNSVRLSVSGSSTGAGIASHRKNGFKVEQRDVNGDGILDLVMKFNTSEIGLQSDDTSVQLTGDLLPGLGIDSFLVEQAVTVGGGGGKGNGGGKGKNK